MDINNLLQNVGWALNKVLAQSENQALLSGKILAEGMKSKKYIDNLGQVEFKVFSQFGDDGIIQWLVHNLDIPNKTFIEFGVEDYLESNTRFLMINDNWSGFVMDGSEQNIARIINSEYYWKHELFLKCAFVDSTNINALIASCSFDKNVGLLHIDLDGNDYWIWKEINVITPIILILEYNSVFGIDRAISVPYDKGFMRTKSHYSNLYFGASLRALHTLSAAKGYSFIGCNSAGNNAYFVRNDKLNEIVKKTSLEDGYVISKYRESRDRNGKLTYAAGSERIKTLIGMPVVNTDTGEIETL